jgi:hypothetical protein
MKKATRNRILSLARLFDRWAKGLRQYEAKRRPKRAKRIAAPQ